MDRYLIKAIQRRVVGSWLVTCCALACVDAFAAQPVASSAACKKSWGAWESFKKAMVSDGGRVVDNSAENKPTTSEGQAYALFFALVADDRETFARILKWTENNLAQGDLTAHLPAWIWGKKPDGNWDVIDSNAASDADLWLAYTLGEAGRLWGERRYVALSSLVANRILREETAEVPGLGFTLLPGPSGFISDDTSWKLNPSYMPLQLMHWFVTHSTDVRWQKLLDSSRRIIVESSPKGFTPDWVIYRKDAGFQLNAQIAQSEEKAEGSYNAIRVYLWAGMLAENTPDRQILIDRLKPMAQFVQAKGYPPRVVNVLSGESGDAGSSGFSAALLPFLLATGMHTAYDEQRLRIESRPLQTDAYYEQVLGLYGLGWQDYYHFAPSGDVIPRWNTCQ